MTEFDIDFLRQTESELRGIPLCDTRMTFYYDETGNCGKFKVTETGVNDTIALTRDFILGGIAFDGDECTADIDSLFASLNLKKEAAELKFRHISRKKNEFLECFGSKRARVFIRWRLSQELCKPPSWCRIKSISLEVYEYVEKEPHSGRKRAASEDSRAAAGSQHHQHGRYPEPVQGDHRRIHGERIGSGAG